MRAVVIHPPHDLRVEDCPLADPGPGQVRVAIRAGGICGSDLHYYQHGGFGTVRVKHPMVLGHEVAGIVEAVGAGVTGIAPGQAVAVNPSLPCGACSFCQAGEQQHCLEMRFYGSAMRDPHVDGGFREALVCEAAQAVPLPEGLDTTTAAFAEPLSVCLHAVRQAGPLLGRRVLVTGAGPIGALTIAAARLAGAREIVATDLTTRARDDRARHGRGPLHRRRRRAGRAGTLRRAEGLFRRGLRGVGQRAAPCSASCRCCARAGPSCRSASAVMSPCRCRCWRRRRSPGAAPSASTRNSSSRSRRWRAAPIDVAPLLTAHFPVDRAAEAFALAADRSRAMKVQIAF